MKLKIKKNTIKHLSNKRSLNLDVTPNIAGGKPLIETRAACHSEWACTHPQACLS
ncbi:hypothetical protein N474_01510 [Pseudoalteromonas luteoviolacea CPMOR-2]|uniref:hypothetical protein n=1 Tax=Pseudoalteromonas luteoviolacea TaxID=43657 RepID=UPI0007B1712B|nr:hypothetical protein [Pseudoalteromonas luteoviolacea]KZN54419.1 hypothetical protein N474_01510 [Pseudoalteromonas luteoviolacea CPMOR-2]